MYKAQHLLGFVVFIRFIMEKFISTIIISFIAAIGFSQNVYDQLHNSIERTEGGAGANVEYHIYLSTTNEKVFFAKDWENGKVIKNEDGDPVCFELTRKKDDEEESLVINLETVSYLELEVKTIKGKKEFSYHFYY